MLSSQTPDSPTGRETKAFEETFQEAEPLTVKWVNSVIVEACNPSRTKSLANEDLVRLEEYIKEFPAKYVYTHHASSKQPLTEKIRKSMTANVKSSAYENLLNPRNKNKFGRNDGKFVDTDTQIFNFARDEVLKNTSTTKPAILHEHLASYMKSIGQISCGRIRGTCWLVNDTLVITNFHVYTMINEEREELQNLNLPITVTFDYFYSAQTEHFVTVEVDALRDPQLENPHLDYKFLCLRENEGLRDRVRLGTVVHYTKVSSLSLVIIHQEAKCKKKHALLLEITCGVRDYSKGCAGVHMTTPEILESNERFRECLPYDTSLFSGASGSPVFDLNGNIVAMHTQGYTCTRRSGKKVLRDGIWCSV